MDDHIGTRETAQNCLFNLLGHQMRLNKREIVVHFQMNLNKASRP